MIEPQPFELPIAGGTYVQHPDGRLERVSDPEPESPEPAASPEPKARTSRSKE